MKKSVVFVFVVLAMSVVNAIPTLEFQNEDIRVGETILATISTGGEFSGDELTRDDIGFYQGRKKKYFEYDMIFYDNVYYIYAYARNAGNYSLKTSKILYKEGNSYKSVSLDVLFEISEGLIDPETNETFSQALEINPGFLYTPDEESVKITNKGTVPLEVEYGKNKISLSTSETKEIFPDLSKNFSVIEIKSYKTFVIPVINPNSKPEFHSSVIDAILESEPDVIVLEFFVDEEVVLDVSLYNPGTSNMTDFEIGVSLPFVEIGEFDYLEAKDSKNLTILATAKDAGHFQGIVNITYFIDGEKELLEIPLNLFVLPEDRNESDFKILNNSCKNLGGEVCGKGYVCNDSSSRFTDDGKWCCFDECVERENDEDNEGGKSYGWLVAIIIIVLLGGLGFYMYKKQKKGGASKKKEDPLKKSVEGYEKRVAPKKPEANRVSGNLSKN